MIARLRRRHRRLVILLALAAPLLLALGLMGRRPLFRVDALPNFSQEDHFAAAQILAERDDLFEHPISLRLLSLEGHRGIELRAIRSLRAPDILVYWSARDDPDRALPEGAHLLGRLQGLAPCRAALPEGARGGLVILYSLGHTRRLDSAPLEALFAAEAP